MKIVPKVACLAAATLAFAGCGDDADNEQDLTTPDPPRPTQTQDGERSSIEFEMQEMDDSGISGQVTITRLPSSTGEQGQEPVDPEDQEQERTDGPVVEAEVSNGQADASTQQPGQVLQVTIELEGDQAGEVARPAHIHRGEACDDAEPAPLFLLTDVVEGRSETTIKVTGNQLDEGNYVINVHESEQNIETYIACGELPSDELSELLDAEASE